MSFDEIAAMIQQFFEIFAKNSSNCSRYNCLDYQSFLVTMNFRQRRIDIAFSLLIFVGFLLWPVATGHHRKSENVTHHLKHHKCENLSKIPTIFHCLGIERCSHEGKCAKQKPSLARAPLRANVHHGCGGAVAYAAMPMPRQYVRRRRAACCRDRAAAAATQSGLFQSLGPIGCCENSLLSWTI